MRKGQEGKGGQEEGEKTNCLMPLTKDYRSERLGSKWLTMFKLFWS